MPNTRFQYKHMDTTAWKKKDLQTGTQTEEK